MAPGSAAPFSATSAWHCITSSATHWRQLQAAPCGSAHGGAAARDRLQRGRRAGSHAADRARARHARSTERCRGSVRPSASERCSGCTSRHRHAPKRHRPCCRHRREQSVLESASHRVGPAHRDPRAAAAGLRGRSSRISGLADAAPHRMSEDRREDWGSERRAAAPLRGDAGGPDRTRLYLVKSRAGTILRADGLEAGRPMYSHSG